jgi:hypothetical protein
MQPEPKSLLKTLFIKLLYLTPFGYMIDVINLLDKNNALKNNKGVSFSFDQDKNIGEVEIDQNPTTKIRWYWVFNGLVLLLQSVIAVRYGLYLNSEDLAQWPMMYAFFAAMTGIVSLVSAVYPHMPWNKKLF